jgi:hypothetical protein
MFFYWMPALTGMQLIRLYKSDFDSSKNLFYPMTANDVALSGKGFLNTNASVYTSY